MEGKGWSLTRERRNRLEDARCLVACCASVPAGQCRPLFQPPCTGVAPHQQSAARQTRRSALACRLLTAAFSMLQREGQE